MMATHRHPCGTRPIGKDQSCRCRTNGPTVHFNLSRLNGGYVGPGSKTIILGAALLAELATVESA